MVTPELIHTLLPIVWLLQAGELKHRLLTFIDVHTPIIVLASDNELLEKLKSNVEEVPVRGVIIYVFADKDSYCESDGAIRVINVNRTDDIITPIAYTLLLQLLSYIVR